MPLYNMALAKFRNESAKIINFGFVFEIYKP